MFHAAEDGDLKDGVDIRNLPVYAGIKPHNFIFSLCRSLQVPSPFFFLFFFLSFLSPFSKLRSLIADALIEYCKRATLRPLLVGEPACGACALDYLAKLVYLRRRETRAGHASGQDGVAQLLLSHSCKLY